MVNRRPRGLSSIGTPVAGDVIPIDDTSLPTSTEVKKVDVAELYNRDNHTGTQLASTVSDFNAAVQTNKIDDLTAPDDNTDLDATGTVHGLMPKADKTKIDGIASGATANDTDANLKARANHTGTQTASTISDFDSQVRTSRLDQMASPTANLSINSNKLTNVVDPTVDQDAATKAYVDNIEQGIRWKESVRIASTGNLTLSGEQTIDGILTSTDRILVKDQSTGSENGIYVTAAGAWVRAIDFNENDEVGQSAVFVQEGTTNADTGWVMTNDGAITLGTTALTFVQFTSLGQIIAGAGLTKTGSTLDAVGTASRIIVNANDIDIAAAFETLVKARANHTGTQLASTISDFDTQVRTSKLEEMAAATDVTTRDATSSLHGLMPKLDKTKLDGIESGATADQSNAEIKTAYEANANTNEYDDAEQTKLAGIAAGATVNATDAALRARASHTGSQAATTVADGSVSDAEFQRLDGLTEDILTSLNRVKVQALIVAVSDETTVLSTGTAKTTFRIPYAFTLTEVRASLTTAGTGAALVTVDINEGGTSILSTKITIDATEKTSQTAITPPVISDAALANDAEMTVDIDIIDTDNVATGLKIYLIGSKT